MGLFCRVSCLSPRALQRIFPFVTSAQNTCTESLFSKVARGKTEDKARVGAHLPSLTSPPRRGPSLARAEHTACCRPPVPHSGFFSSLPLETPIFSSSRPNVMDFFFSCKRNNVRSLESHRPFAFTSANAVAVV